MGTVIVAEIDGSRDDQVIINEFLTAHPTAKLLAKDSSLDRVHLSNVRGVREAMSSALTPRQIEVLQMAVEKGYFERPRETSGAELAAELGIAPATLSQHLRAAIQKTFKILVDNRTI